MTLKIETEEDLDEHGIIVAEAVKPLMKFFNAAVVLIPADDPTCIVFAPLTIGAPEEARKHILEAFSNYIKKDTEGSA